MVQGPAGTGLSDKEVTEMRNSLRLSVGAKRVELRRHHWSGLLPHPPPRPEMAAEEGTLADTRGGA